jgi:hypothetical protein
MTRRALYALPLITAIAVVAAVGILRGQTTANGPYYAWPSWDQTLPSSIRFIVLANMASEAVLDRETGLVWQRQPNISLTWLGGHDYCNNLSIGGRKGWRLPTLQELASLQDPSQPTAPRLPPGHPFIVSAWGFQSATESASDPANYYWMASFTSSFDSSPQSKGGINPIWCVRGGQGAPRQ